ncbi:CvpA family protein [Arenicella sp. 4NH20-0111]|uniref:CvpA family protein n=1 Tax=Arenicella sp. 4NH20-0111 TaxID=3127648 RepID=UPI00310AAD93
MTAFDLILLAIFIISTVVGVMRGFVKEALSIISWILAFWLGYTYCVQAGEWLAQFASLGEGRIRNSAGFALVFIGTLFVFALISYVVTKIVVRGPIKGVDRVLGIATGFVRAIAISAVMLVLMQALGMNSSAFWNESRLVPHLMPAVKFAQQVLPKLWQSDEPLKDGELKDKLIDKGVEHIKTGGAEI